MDVDQYLVGTIAGSAAHAVFGHADGVPGYIFTIAFFIGVGLPDMILAIAASDSRSWCDVKRTLY